MNNVIEFRPNTEKLKAKRIELLNKRDKMPINCPTKDWFAVCNEIRAVEMQIRKYENAFSYS